MAPAAEACPEWRPLRGAAGATLLGLLLASATLLSTTNAAALEPAFTKNRLTLEGGPRFGTNDLNLGLGERLDYTIEQSVSFGVLGDYWFGESEETSLLGFTTEASATGWDLMGVAGYDFGITPKFVLRPFGGAGIFGGQAMVLLGDTLHLGGELRVMFAEDTAVVFAANVGAVF